MLVEIWNRVFGAETPRPSLTEEEVREVVEAVDLDLAAEMEAVDLDLVGRDRQRPIRRHLLRSRPEERMPAPTDSWSRLWSDTWRPKQG